MERCKTLINKLQEQANANADPSVMMITLQMLHTELARLAAERPEQKGTNSVSVVLPGYRKPFEPVAEAVAAPAEETIQVRVAERKPAPEAVYAPRNPDVAEIPAPERTRDTTPLAGRTYVPDITPLPEKAAFTGPAAPVIAEEDLKRIPEEKLPAGIIFPVADQPGNREVWVLNPVMETPTLAHQDEIKELNEKIGKLGGESLNDRLKTSKIDISSFLTEAPVKELKKAIGVNDRFLFINELFRGDVDMYERSIKTINNFRILPEAEYWIERELKIKLAWDNATEAAMLFYQLVKRRFS